MEHGPALLRHRRPFTFTTVRVNGRGRSAPPARAKRARIRRCLAAGGNLGRLQLLAVLIGAAIQRLEELAVFHADMQGQESLWQADFRGRTALLIGGEAEGISPEGQQLATHSVRIPMTGKTESLNAAVSASVLMFEVLRQRSQKV